MTRKRRCWGDASTGLASIPSPTSPLPIRCGRDQVEFEFLIIKIPLLPGVRSHGHDTREEGGSKISGLPLPRTRLFLRVRVPPSNNGELFENHFAY